MLKRITLIIIILVSISFSKTVIKMATLVPEGTNWHGLMVEMGQRWKAETNGSVVLRIYPSGVVGDERDMIRKMRIGQIQAAAISLEGLSELNSDVYAFYIPLLLKDYDDVDWYREKISEQLVKGIEKNGFKLLFWADIGWAKWFAKEPVRLPDDLKKTKIFTWSGDFKSTELWKKGGFNPVPLAATDVLTGLQSGLVNAIATPPIYALSSQWFGIADHMLDLNWGVLSAAIVIDIRTWNKINAKNQKIIMDIARETSEKHQRENRHEDKKAIDVMEEYGLKVHTPSDSEREEWDRYIESWYPRLRGAYVPEDIFDTMMQLKQERDTQVNQRQ